MDEKQQVALLKESAQMVLQQGTKSSKYENFLDALVECFNLRHAFICSHDINKEHALSMKVRYSSMHDKSSKLTASLQCTYDAFSTLHEQVNEQQILFFSADSAKDPLQSWMQKVSFDEVVMIAIVMADSFWGVLLLEGQGVAALHDEKELLFSLSHMISSSLFCENMQSVLDEQQSNFNHIFNQSNTIMFVLDAEHLTILAANKGVENFYGYTLIELMGESFSNICACTAGELSSLILGEQAFDEKEHHFIHFTKQKKQRHVLMYPSSVNLLANEAFLVIVFDISKRFESFKREKLYAKIFDTSDEGIMICDTNEAIVEVNPAFEKITGYSKKEVLGKTPRVLASNIHDTAFYANMWHAIDSTGHYEGEFWNKKPNGDLYAIHTNITELRDDEGEIANYAGIFSDITKLKEHEQQLYRQAHYDALTQLPNRTILYDRLQMGISFSKRYNTQLALCFIDLDEFKPINDTYGHEVGDDVLIHIAKRLKECVRLSDTVSRLGGDEFVIIISECESMIGLQTLLERLLDTVSQPIVIRGNSVKVTASIGVALSHLTTDNPEMLLRQADQAMYRAKQEGRNAFHIFDEKNDETVTQRHATINEMRDAIKKNEFILYYQPKVQMSASKVIGVEALIRWQHPTRGLLGPFAFLPYIDGHEFSLRLDMWVLEQAFKQSILFEEKKIFISISVNISGDTLLNPLFLQTLFSLITRFPELNKKRIELEVLETSTLHDLEKATEVLLACKELGFTLALDDFGTGYSSLTYLRHLPVHTIKIDQSFVRDILEDSDDHVLVQSLINLVGAYKLNIIAEGVESEAIGKELLTMDCDYAQGYGIAKPMPIKDFMQWLKTWHAPASWQAFAKNDDLKGFGKTK